MPAERHSAVGNLAVAFFCATLFGFAVGAAWMVPSMMFGRPLPVLALPLGWMLGVAVRRWLGVAGAPGALLAAWATALACTYTACLVAAARIASVMGIGFGDAISEAGAGMLLSLARLAQGPADLLAYGAGILLGAAAAAVRRGPPPLQNS
jgi:hypothetical protein